MGREKAWDPWIKEMSARRREEDKRRGKEWQRMTEKMGSGIN